MNVTLALFVTVQFESIKYRPSSQEMRVLVAVPLSAVSSAIALIFPMIL